ncbi:hypothetical protein AVDCRST_MAG94-6963 [uncultured Leptolyngbya sp.]|uniref:Uncharacterized protein n=2 Tax=Cyanophyceae TaxID=3028117 RepID=A0A6J4PN40_9CYAN|nr:hypothetical protein AVDCRST_MAG94-6963 [uncultured Leptolyngbya sp.]CAA9553937.1 hypothetical protein AVDCRST_MAG81-63 [uncultured Synechococcales cyanobacterium]
MLIERFGTPWMINDLDGHIWEILFMEESAIAQG